MGDPADPATDVAPVIDQAAYDRLMAYRAARADDIIHTLTAPETGLFVPPTLIGLDAIEDLTAEWFGPIVHLATFKSGALDGYRAAHQCDGIRPDDGPAQPRCARGDVG